MPLLCTSEGEIFRSASMDTMASQPALHLQGFSSELNTHISKLVYPIIKTIMFLTFTTFILCIPLGDPEKECPPASYCAQTQGKAIAYNYMCNLYKFLYSSAALISQSLHKLTKFTGHVVMNALYDAKIKFYNLLETVDRQDLCRSVCCIENVNMGEADSLSGDRDKLKKPCKCKGKLRR